MTVLGNILLGLAAFLFVVPMQVVLNGRSKGPKASVGYAVGTTLVSIPLWLCLLGAFAVATSQGRFDWLKVGRPAQYLVVLLVALSMAVVAWFSFVVRGEPKSQIPWAIRFLAPWAGYALPLVALAEGALALNPSLGGGHQVMGLRVPLGIVTGGSLLVCAALIVEGILHLRRRSRSRVRKSVTEATDRDRSIMAEVERLDPIADFGRLLTFTNRFETDSIRELALKKVRSHPSFPAELAVCLGGDRCGEALIFLDGNEAPNPAALAEPAQRAFLRTAKRVRKDLRTAHWLHDDSFDADARRILTVAGKLAGQGVDFSLAIREFRAALEEPRSQKINPQCRGALDEWLAKQAPAKG